MTTRNRTYFKRVVLGLWGWESSNISVVDLDIWCHLSCYWALDDWALHVCIWQINVPKRLISWFGDIPWFKDHLTWALKIFSCGGTWSLFILSQTSHIEQTEVGNQRLEIAAIDGEMMTSEMANFLQKREFAF